MQRRNLQGKQERGHERLLQGRDHEQLQRPSLLYTSAAAYSSTAMAVAPPAAAQQVSERLVVCVPPLEPTCAPEDSALRAVGKGGNDPPASSLTERATRFFYFETLSKCLQ